MKLETHENQSSKPHNRESVISVNTKELSYVLMEALYIGKHSACSNIADIASQLREAAEEGNSVGEVANRKDFKRGYDDALGFLICYSQDYSDRVLSNAHEVAEYLIAALESGEFSEEQLQ